MWVKVFGSWVTWSGVPGGLGLKLLKVTEVVCF